MEPSDEEEEEEVKPWSRFTANDHEAGPSDEGAMDIYDDDDDFDSYLQRNAPPKS